MTIAYPSKKLFFVMSALLILRPILTLGVQEDGLHPNIILSALVIMLAIGLVVMSGDLFVTKPMLLFLVLTFLSFFYGVNIKIVLPDFLKILSFFSIFSIFWFISKNNNSINITSISLVSAIFPILFGMLQFARGDFFYFYTDYTHGTTAARAIKSTFIHPNDFSIFLLVPFAIILASIVAPEKKPMQRWRILLLCLVTVMIYLTQARVALGACFVILLTQLLISKKNKISLVLFILPIIFFTLAGYFILKVSGGKGLSSFTWRVNLWLNFIESLSGAKVLTGNGLGYASFIINKFLGYNNQINNPHSEYVRLYIELGLTGLFLLLYLLWKNIKAAFKMLYSYSTVNNIQLYRLCLIVISLSLALLAAATTENVLYNLAFQWLYWALAGTLFGFSSKNSLVKTNDTNKLLDAKI